jgi:hypothetical protein
MVLSGVAIDRDRLRDKLLGAMEAVRTKAKGDGESRNHTVGAFNEHEDRSFQGLDLNSLFVERFYLDRLFEGGGISQSEDRIVESIIGWMDALGYSDMDQLNFKVLGVGCSGVVLGIEYENAQDYAIKIAKESVSYEQDWNKRSDVDLAVSVGSDSNSVLESRSNCLIMKWHKGGTLADYLSRNDVFFEQKAAATAGFIRNLPIECHNDLKPENVFIETDDGGNVKKYIYFDPFELKCHKPLDANGDHDDRMASEADELKIKISSFIRGLAEARKQEVKLFGFNSVKMEFPSGIEGVDSENHARLKKFFIDCDHIIQKFNCLFKFSLEGALENGAEAVADSMLNIVKDHISDCFALSLGKGPTEMAEKCYKNINSLELLGKLLEESKSFDEQKEIIEKLIALGDFEKQKKLIEYCFFGGASVLDGSNTVVLPLSSALQDFSQEGNALYEGLKKICLDVPAGDRSEFLMACDIRVSDGQYSLSQECCLKVKKIIECYHFFGTSVLEKTEDISPLYDSLIDFKGKDENAYEDLKKICLGVPAGDRLDFWRACNIYVDEKKNSFFDLGSYKDEGAWKLKVSRVFIHEKSFNKFRHAFDRDEFRHGFVRFLRVIFIIPGLFGMIRRRNDEGSRGHSTTNFKKILECKGSIFSEMGGSVPA